MGGLRRDNMLILYGMGGRERLFIDGMGGLIHGWIGYSNGKVV